MDDEAFALSLQEEYDREIINLEENWVKDDALNPYSSIHGSQFTAERTPKSIVDPAWELLEPNPDIRALFQEFNATYFWGKLSMVEVKWSPRMTLCAGLCCYEGRGGLCSIRLSQPLLRLRPRKDLVETLLHEMIHALLFITDNNKDHDGHGPEFCKHMKRINAASGTNITIYHSFHDEVDSLRQHWWRCQGPCRSTPPYFGYVRRSMNRAPSARDPWWPQHERKCGGTYEKVKEPENYGKKKANKKMAKPAIEKGAADITPFLYQVTKSVSGNNNTSSLNANELTSTSSAAKTETSGSGHRLGGIMPSQTNNRGIPSTSRLLNFQTTQSNNHPSENVRSEAVAPNDRKGNDVFALHTLTGEKLTDKNKWTKLLTTKRRSLTAGSEIPTKRGKGGITIPELVSRMKRKRQKSVSAGAPAFHMTPPVTNFSKNAIHFQDSEDSQSEKENRMEITAEVKLKKEFPSRAPGTNPLMQSPLPSFDSDNEDSCVLGDRTTFWRKDPLLKRQDHNLVDVVLEDPDDCLHKVEFVKNNILSDLDLNQNEPKTQALESSTNGRFFGKRLPSLSDDDESETLSEIWKNSSRNSEMPLNKKFKPNDENLPEICSKDPDRHSKTNLQNLPGTSKNWGSSDDVPCPICNEMYSIASINYHIDDCLSLKAIRDSTFG